MLLREASAAAWRETLEARAIDDDEAAEAARMIRGLMRDRTIGREARLAQVEKIVSSLEAGGAVESATEDDHDYDAAARAKWEPWSEQLRAIVADLTLTRSEKVAKVGAIVERLLDAREAEEAAAQTYNPNPPAPTAGEARPMESFGDDDGAALESFVAGLRNTAPAARGKALARGLRYGVDL